MRLGIAFILRSLKRPEEIRALRSIYGQSLYIFSVYSSKNKRVDALALEIMRSRHDSERSKYRGKAEQLAQIDEEELGTNFGQNVRDAFPLADFFVRADDRARLAEQVRFAAEFDPTALDESGETKKNMSKD